MSPIQEDKPNSERMGDRKAESQLGVDNGNYNSRRLAIHCPRNTHTLL